MEINKNQIYMLDGAMGSECIKRTNLEGGFFMEKLNYMGAETIKSIHRDYINAGSNFIFANTFGANPQKFPNEEEMQKVISCGIANAKEVASDKAYVGLDIGPHGNFVGELGIPFEESKDIYAKMIKMAEDKSDFIIFETFMDTEDMKSALQASKENSNLPIFASMTFGESKRTIFGATIEDFVSLAKEYNVTAVGINCTLSPAQMLNLVETLKNCAGETPIFTKPNAGAPKVSNGIVSYDTTAEIFAEDMAKIHELGVNILGGCCGTTPEYISKMAKAIKNK